MAEDEGENVKILISVGPIPAKLDSVKFLTNRFKGGLALKTAAMLAENHEITIVKWKNTTIDWTKKMSHFVDSDFRMIDVDDVIDYKEKVLNEKADVYVLAAAVANLMPSNPWKGKFPSHNYKVGEQFDIKFEIAPRIIDEIKKKYPRAGLVGYKLFDGTDEELVEAGWETLINSKANIVFANHPKWAKERKIMLTSDGAEVPVSFDEHVDMIDKLADAKYFKTEVNPSFGLLMPDPLMDEDVKDFVQKYPKYEKHGFTFGTFAIRMGTKDKCMFLTTSRGKRDSGFAKVIDIDFGQKEIYAAEKATLNAPFLGMLLRLNPQINVLIHGHKKICDYPSVPYVFPGTTQEVNSAGGMNFKISPVYNIEYHGYVAGFETIKECLEWMKKHES